MSGSWDAALSSSEITISGNGLTAARADASGGWVMALSTPSGTSKSYAEVTVGTFSPAASIGLANTNEVTGPDPNAWPGASNNSIGLNNFGDVYYGGSKIGSAISYATGDVVGVAIDGSAQTIEFCNVTQHSQWFGPFPISLGSAPYHLALGLMSQGNSGTANFTGPFLGTLPPGYVGWGASAPASGGWKQKAYYTTHNVFGNPGDPAPGAWAVQTYYETHSPTALT